MADDSADEIYVDVVARLDEKAADQAAEKLSDKFKNVGKNIGEHIKDATKGIGDYLEQDIKDSVKDFGRNLRDEIKSGDIKGALEDIGGTVEKTTDLISGVGKVFGVNGIDSFGRGITDTISGLERGVDTVTNKINTFKDGLHALRSGDITQGIQGLSNAFRGIVPDSFLDNANSALKVFSDTHDTIKNTLKDTIDTGLELQAALGFAGRGAPALAGAGEVTGPLAALLAAGFTAGTFGFGPLFKHDFESWAYGDQGIRKPLHALGGFPDRPIPGLAAVTGQPTSAPISKPDSFAPLDLPDNPAIPTNSPLYAPKPTAPGGGSTSTASANIQAAQASVQAAAATVIASSLSLGGLSLPQVVSSAAPGAGSAPGSKSWWSSSASSTPSFASGFPTLPGHSTGGVLPGSSPGYDNLLGALGGTPVGLEGGEFVVNPQATQANLGLLQAINGGMMGFDGGGGPIDQILGGGTNVHNQSPGGVKGQQPGGVRGQLPQGVMPDQSSRPLKSADKSPGEPNPPQTIIPQGQGKGFTLSGGAVGAAEGAAAAAADFFAPGSGAAVQIGMQEANRAIEYGVKAGITLGVEAPLDTLWVSGSQLADPSHSWFGKLGLNLIGQTGQAAQNLAGKTQAPLTPGQGDGSPLGGQQGKQGPMIHIENQNNGSDVDHEANNRSLVNQMNAYANY